MTIHDLIELAAYEGAPQSLLRAMRQSKAKTAAQFWQTRTMSHSIRDYWDDVWAYHNLLDWSNTSGVERNHLNYDRIATGTAASLARAFAEE